MRPRTLIAALTSAALGLALLTATPAAAASRALAWDFNGDGFRDLAVGVPTGTADGKREAGYVVIVPGSASGPASDRRRIVSQTSTVVPGSSETGDRFGEQLASLDLNSDGYAELVVAAPGENSDTGRITIVWSGRSGFTGGTTVSGDGIGEGFGGSGLAIADLTGDRRADIVEVAFGEEGAGGAAVLRGPFAPGRTPQVNYLSSGGGVGFEEWQSGPAVGDFDGDGFADLALAYGGGEYNSTVFWRGTSTGLVHTNDWYRETIAQTLAAGDFDGDGFADLAYGMPETGLEGEPQYPVKDDGEGAGSIRIVYGSSNGIGGTRPPVDLDQDSPGVPSSSEPGDQFGRSLAVADIDGDGYRELAVGAPGESIGSATRTGAATVLYGSATGITGGGAQFFSQDTAGVSGSNEPFDEFSASLRLRDYNGNARPELAVGIPSENSDSGRVVTLPGGTGGITGTGSKSYSATGLRLPGAGSGFLRFGGHIG